MVIGAVRCGTGDRPAGLFLKSPASATAGRQRGKATDTADSNGDPRHHAQKVAKRLQETITHLRKDVTKVAADDAFDSTSLCGFDQPALTRRQRVHTSPAHIGRPT